MYCLHSNSPFVLIVGSLRPINQRSHSSALSVTKSTHAANPYPLCNTKSCTGADREGPMHSLLPASDEQCLLFAVSRRPPNRPECSDSSVRPAAQTTPASALRLMQSLSPGHVQIGLFFDCIMFGPPAPSAAATVFMCAARVAGRCPCQWGMSVRRLFRTAWLYDTLGCLQV